MSPSPPARTVPALSDVVLELARLRSRVASEDRTVLFDAIRKVESELREIERASRVHARDVT